MARPNPAAAEKPCRIGGRGLVVLRTSMDLQLQEHPLTCQLRDFLSCCFSLRATLDSRSASSLLAWLGVADGRSELERPSWGALERDPRRGRDGELSSTVPTMTREGNLKSWPMDNLRLPVASQTEISARNPAMRHSLISPISRVKMERVESRALSSTMLTKPELPLLIETRGCEVN